MAQDYLGDFQKKVKSLHDPSNKTCHWTPNEETTYDLTPVKDEKGPCNCPEKNPACAPCSCISCASTAQVLAKDAPRCEKYKDKLKKLAEWMENIEEGIKKGDEVYDTLVNGKNDMSPSEALNDSVLKNTIINYYQQNAPSIKGILKLKLSVEPDPSPISPKVCEACWKVKKDRLDTEKKAFKALKEDATTAGNALLDEYKENEANFSNTLLPVLKGSLKIVGSALDGDAKGAVDGARELLEHYKKGLKDGGRMYLFMKSVHAVGLQKKTAMLIAIYHDQQHDSDTCKKSDLVMRDRRRRRGEEPV